MTDGIKDANTVAEKRKHWDHVMNAPPVWGCIVLEDDKPGVFPRVVNIDRVRAATALLIDALEARGE